MCILPPCIISTVCMQGRYLLVGSCTPLRAGWGRTMSFKVDEAAQPSECSSLDVSDVGIKPASLLARCCCTQTIHFVATSFVRSLRVCSCPVGQLRTRTPAVSPEHRHKGAGRNERPPLCCCPVGSCGGGEAAIRHNNAVQTNAVVPPRRTQCNGTLARARREDAGLLLLVFGFYAPSERGRLEDNVDVAARLRGGSLTAGKPLVLSDGERCFVGPCYSLSPPPLSIFACMASR